MVPPRCLVVDPDRAFAVILSGIIGRHGFETAIIHDPLTALRELRHTKFDLVVLDLSVIGGDFPMVLETIRREIPAVLERTVIVTTNPLVARDVPAGVPVVGKSDLKPLMDYLNR
jgi:CheY-like chemotaxis protein